MAKQRRGAARPTSNFLHPVVYKAAVALALWFALSAWLLFKGGNEMGLVLAFVSVPILMAIAIPYALSRVPRRPRTSDAASGTRRSVREWMSRDFETTYGRRKGWSATVEILLPLAAVAFGMTAIGIVLCLTVAGAG
jgi:hypothetical protein